MGRKSPHTSIEAVVAIRTALRFAGDKGLPVAIIARQAELSTSYVRKILYGHPNQFEKSEVMGDWTPYWTMKHSDEFRSSQQIELRRDR